MTFQKGKPKTGGRGPGVANKNTTMLKDAILDAATAEGNGDLTAYLQKQAREQPAAFLTLLGKILPLQVTGDMQHPLVITRVERVLIDPKLPEGHNIITLPPPGGAQKP